MEPAQILSGLVIGLIGFALFRYGRQAERPPFLLTGIALMTFPAFVHSVLAMWLVAAACIGGSWLIGRLA